MKATILTSIQLCKKGVRLRDRVCALMLAAYPVIGHHRTFVRKFIRMLLRALAGSELLSVSIYIKGLKRTLKLRVCNDADLISAGEFIRDEYESPSCRPSQIIDGGGNIGIFTLLASAHFPSVPVTVYEPDPDNFRLLSINMRENGIVANLINKGVWSSDVNLYYHAQTSNSGYVDEHPPGQAIPCEFPSIDDNTWLKLDVEGAEHEVIPEMIKRKIFPYHISMEVHNNKEKGDLIKSLLETAGYQIVEWPSFDHDCGVALCRMPQDRGITL